MGRLKLISVDKRRRKVRVTPFGWTVFAVVGLLVCSASVWGISKIAAGLGGVQLVATAVPTATATEAPDATATEYSPTAQPTEAPVTEEACPSDPAEWYLVPYEYPGAPVDLYTIEPVCVMEAVEQAYQVFADARAEKGRNWTREDEEYFYTQATVTTIINGETLYGLGDVVSYECRGAEATKPDGTRYTGEDADVVFYTAGESGVVVDLLSIIRGSTTIRVYDCDTGELLSEELQPDVVALIHQPMVYDSELGRWQLTRGVDALEQVEPDGIDIEALITLIRKAQGRSTP